MNLVEQLLKVDAKKVKMPSEVIKLKLEKLGGAEFDFTCYGLTNKKFNGIQDDALIMKKGKVQGVNTEQMHKDTLLAGIPELKDVKLMEHFKIPTPEDLIDLLFLPGDIKELGDIIAKLSGFKDDAEEIEKTKEEIKNS